MREFIFYSGSAVTSGKMIGNDLMVAGRMDIVCNFIINSFFVSHNSRDDVRLHLIFNGTPDHPKYIEIAPHKIAIPSANNIDVAAKDVAGVLKKVLDGYVKDKRIEVLPNFFVEKKGLREVIEKVGIERVVLLDKKGEGIRDIEGLDNVVFLIGDQDGFPKYEEKWLKKAGIRRVSLGKKMYLAVQTLVVLQNELDIRETCFARY